MADRIKIILIFIASFNLMSCRKTNPEVYSPMTIQTHLTGKYNFIQNILALDDNSFVVQMLDNEYQQILFYKFNDKLILTDSLAIMGLNCTQMVKETDQSITFMIESTGGVNACNMSYNLKLNKRRIVEFMYYDLPNSARYPSSLVKLTNGNYVVGHISTVPGAGHKMTLFGVADLFTSNQVLWRYQNPVWNKDWLCQLIAGPDADFYTTAFDNYVHQENFLKKFNFKGKIVFEKVFAANERYTACLVHPDREQIIFDDFKNFHILDTAGNEIKSVYNGGYSGSNSTKVRFNGHYYYYSNLYNSDGMFLQMRKADAGMSILKTAIYGNQGTNLYNPNMKQLIQLPSGELVVAALIENPGLSGNQWLLIKLNEELELAN